MSTPTTDIGQTEPQKPVPTKERTSAVKNVSWVWAGLLANIGISFFMAPFVVRTLGDVQYGIWALLGQFTGYLWLFDFGVRESVIKYVAEYDAADKKEELSSTIHAAVSLYSAISVVVMLGVVAMTISLPYAFKIPAESTTAARVTLFITGVTIALGFVFNVYVGVLMGIQRFYLVDRLGIMLAIPRTVLTVVLLSAGYGIVALAAIQFTISLAGNLWIYRLCRVHLPYLSFRLARPKREDVRKVIDYGKYVLVNNLGEKLVYASDALVVGMFLPIANLTYYAIPATLIGYLKSFVTSMASVVNPMSSALESTKDVGRLKSIFLTSAKAAMLVGMPVCIGFIVLGARFISVWMGPAFGPTAGQVLMVLGVAHLIGMPYYTIQNVLYGLSQPRIIARARILEAVLNLSLSILLVQRYGVLGVAIGTMIPHVVVAALVLPALMPPLLPITLREYYVTIYGRPLLASVPFWIACLAIEKLIGPTTVLTFLASVILALPAYFAPSWFLALDETERDLVGARVRGLLRRKRTA